MRPMFPGDLDHAVRVLLAVPGPQRAGVAQDILSAARVADAYRKRLGRAHPVHGTGSVLSATSGREKATLPGYCNTEYCAALAVFLDMFLADKQR